MYILIITTIPLHSVLGTIQYQTVITCNVCKIYSKSLFTWLTNNYKCMVVVLYMIYAWFHYHLLISTDIYWYLLILLIFSFYWYITDILNCVFYVNISRSSTDITDIISFNWYYWYWYLQPRSKFRGGGGGRTVVLGS